MSRLSLLLRSMRGRGLTTGLTLLSLGLSVALIMGIGRIRTGAQKGFERTLAGVDLVVGARSGNVNLMLATVFHLGNMPNNIKWSSFQEISAHKAVKWAVPISLGDSHRGYRVVGTTGAFFENVKFSGGRNLEFSSGGAFGEGLQVVLGSEVAERLGYGLNASVVLAHGTGEISFQEHSDQPFVVAGILAATGTPTDRSLFISLESMTALHESGDDHAEHDHDHDPHAGHDHSPEQITAIYLGLKNKMAVFNLQRFANEYEKEPLTAILPAATLLEFWQTMGFFEKALAAVSSLVCISGLISMFLSLMTSLGERRREMALFRSLGASPRFVFRLLVAESFLLALGGIFVGAAVSFGALLLARSWLEARLGLSLEIFELSLQEGVYLLILLAGALIVGLWPAWRAYRTSLLDGLTVKR